VSSKKTFTAEDSTSFLKYVGADSSRRHTLTSNPAGQNHFGSTFSQK